MRCKYTLDFGFFPTLQTSFFSTLWLKYSVCFRRLCRAIQFVLVRMLIKLFGVEVELLVDGG